MAHPLHPALVHFPVACWSLGTVADVASVWLGQSAWWLAGVLLVVGTIMALAAMLTGLLELAKIEQPSPAFTDANRHMVLILVAWMLYATSAFLRLQDMTLTAPGMVEIGLSVAGFVVLSAAGWLGGKLVYQHGVGGNRKRA